MSNNKTAQTQKQAEAPKKKEDTSDLLKKVKSLNLAHADTSTIQQLKNTIIDNNELQGTPVQLAAEQATADCIKLSIATEHPEIYPAFKNKSYREIMNLVDLSKINGTANDVLSIKIPQDMLATLPNADTVGLYGTSFSISPNSFWANITNILNEVSVGDNFINTGESFNAWDFYRDVDLASGEASLKTIGDTLSGVCLLNQNQLVPSSTQMLKGYQASLGVFINMDDAQDIGGGTGIGLFTMYSTPINVIKLAVTNPQQFTEMVRIFQATAVNTRDYSLWMITTYNMLSNITNIIVDNYNTNIRNCLNGTLFPAIQVMKNPTNEFNCGLIRTYPVTGSTYTPSSTASSNYYNANGYLSKVQNWNSITTTNNAYIDYEKITSWTASDWNTNCQGTIRLYSGFGGGTVELSTYTSTGAVAPGSTLVMTPTFTHPYMVPGNSTYPRIQCSSAKDMHLIITPKFFVGLKSGTLSQLFHWEYQRLEEYIPPENIHMLYKQVNIPSGYLHDGNVPSGDGNESGYAYNVYASLGAQWFPDECIYLITKPKDSNQWTAAYGWVWTTEMSNQWGAGMIGTNYLQYAIYGGVIPWSNGVCFYMKNLMNFVSDQSQAIMMDFTLGNVIDQTITPPTTAGSGQD